MMPPNVMPSDLPEIICGPIVRRCEVSSTQVTINIWIATKNPYVICGQAYLINKTSQTIYSDHPISESFQTSYQVGENLWAHSIKMVFESTTSARTSENFFYNYAVHPLNEFEFINTGASTNDDGAAVGGRSWVTGRVDPSICYNSLFAYDLLFKLVGDSDSPIPPDEYTPSTYKKLKTFLGNNFKEEFCVGSFDLPTIAIQSSSDDTLKALYGSCRKFHGTDDDASIGMFRAFKENAQYGDYFENRNNALFLTGDQIYADDVHSLLLPYLTHLGDALIGHLEQIPNLPSRNLNQAQSLNDNQSRAKFLKDYAKFSIGEDDGKNHLILLGEYFAMYCMAWNDNLWTPATSTGLLSAYKGTKSLKCLMANIPSYMHFDDHEVTDDFFINDDWKTRAKNSNVGVIVLSNALLAYFVFQAHGNKPAAFNSTHFDNIQNLVKTNFSSNKRITAKTAIFAENKWSYDAPTIPPVFAIDTRTQRIEAPGQNLPNLISTSEYGRVEALIREYYPNPAGKVLMFIVPAPVIGIASIEKAISVLKSGTVVGKVIAEAIEANILISTLKELKDIEQESIESFDYESFAANEASFIKFMNFILELSPKFVGILSGDVHYGSTNFANVRQNSTNAANAIPILQMTSSGFKNKAKVTSGMGAGLRVLQEQVGFYTEYEYLWYNLGGGHYHPVRVKTPSNALPDTSIDMLERTLKVALDALGTPVELVTKNDFLPTKIDYVGTAANFAVSWFFNLPKEVVTHRAIISNNFGVFEVTNTDISNSLISLTADIDSKFSSKYSEWPI